MTNKVTETREKLKNLKEWDALEVLIKGCLNQNQLKQKCNDDVDNYFKEFFQFEDHEYAKPEQRLDYLLSHEDLIEAAKILKIPKKERKDLKKDVLVLKIIEKLGFEVKVPKGITQIVEKVKECKEKINNHISDEALVKGPIVEVFRLLERVFQEIFYAYTQWRFQNDPPEEIFSPWIEENKTVLKSCLKKERSPMLGQWRSILEEIDSTIQNDNNRHYRK